MADLETLLAQERHLVDRLQAGEEAAFAQLYDAYGHNLYLVLLEMLHSATDAEHLLQEAFVKIWSNIHRYDPQKGRLYTWLLTLVRRLAMDFIRSQYFRERQMNQSIEKAVFIESNTSEMARLEYIGMSELVARLEPNLKQVIELQYFMGCTQQEVADMTALPLGTVKSRTRAALTLLRKQLGEIL